MSVQIVPPSRRAFLEHIFSATAFVVSAPLASSVATARQAATAGDGKRWDPSVYLGIEANGDVKIIAHRSEMGTGCRTCLPMIVADELEADWERVTIVQAVGDVKYGSQNTEGSCSVRDFYDAMRLAGAAARTTLAHAAAGRWGVTEGEVQGRNHFVVHTSTSRRIAYEKLIPLVSSATAPSQNEIRYKTPAQFRYVGKDLPIADLDDLVRGKGIFGIDAKIPGMVYAAVERPPVMGARLRQVDDSGVKQVIGVQQVVTLDLAQPPLAFKPLGGAAVIANST